jgi:DNA repair exonuclease SbcCD ATPase subunit
MLEEAETECKNTLDYYTGLETFKKKIKEAESIALATLIDDLNEKFQYYIDMFFEEEKMNISFATFKENKKGDKSVNINLQIFYKGTDTELSALSGGEEDRVEIAFVLALSDIIQSPLLLLDEAISSLDSETCDNVLRKLESTDKCILLIAHQVTKGIFNNVISL